MATSRPRAIVPVSSELGKINMVLYGQPGVGKTALACTGSDTLILASDKEETISGAVLGSTADQWPCPTYSELTEAFEYLRHEEHGYRWVWHDNATLFQEQGMDQIMEDLVAEKPYRDRYIPDVHEYLENQNRYSVWVRNMKALPFNFGIVCHEMRVEDQDSGRVTMLPLLSGKQGEYSQKVCGYMNVVGHMTRVKKGDSYRSILDTNKAGRFYAKDRFNVLGKMVNPTIAQIEAAVAGAQKAATPAQKTTTRRRRSTTRSA